MGRAPCCDKANVKKGPWSPEEDAKLKSYIEQHGTGGNWIALPQKIGLKRCGKSCRLRWLNYLRPNIKHGGFSEEEDNIICSLYISIGSRWSIIAAQLPGRTDNDIKNYWNTRLKKKLLGNTKLRKNHQQQNSTGQLIKHGMAKRGAGFNAVDSMEAMMNNNTNNNNFVHIDGQTPYWPELPVLTPTVQQTRCDDHEFIRKLLIKLGGRFAGNDHDQTVFHSSTTADPAHFHPIDLNTQQLYELVSGDVSTSNPPPDFRSQELGQYNNSQVFPGQSSAATITTDSLAEIEESGVYDNNSGQVLNGLEFFYGSNGHDDVGWGDMSSMAYHSSNVPVTGVSENYEGVERVILSAQECMFGDSSFPKAQRSIP